MDKYDVELIKMLLSLKEKMTQVGAVIKIDVLQKLDENIKRLNEQFEKSNRITRNDAIRVALELYLAMLSEAENG